MSADRQPANIQQSGQGRTHRGMIRRHRYSKTWYTNDTSLTTNGMTHHQMIFIRQ